MFGRIGILGFGLVVTLSCAAHPAPGPDSGVVARCRDLPAGTGDGDGPAALLSEPAFAARPAALGFNTSSLMTTTVTLGGVTAHVLTFKVKTFENRFNRDWVANVTVIAPASPQLSATDAAALVGNVATENPIAPSSGDPTWAAPYPSWWSGTDTSTHFLRSYGSIVATHGIPVVFANPVPSQIAWDAALAAALHAAAAADSDPCNDAECDGLAGVLSDEVSISQCLTSAEFVRKDLTYDPYLNYAVAEMRVLDAAEKALNDFYATLSPTPPVLAWHRVWALGSSKRGAAMRQLAAIDARVRGVVISAANIGNMPVFFDRELALWSGAYSFGAPSQSALLATPFGQTFEKTFDPYRWKPSVLGAKSYGLAMGVADVLYPLSSSFYYSASLPSDLRTLFVPNYGHGTGTIDHLTMLRELVDHGLTGAPWPRVDAAWNQATGIVSAQVSGGEAAAAELWCTQSLATNSAIQTTRGDCSKSVMPAADDTDLRDDVWGRLAMTGTSPGAYEASVPAFAVRYPACIVRVRTTDGKVATSPPLMGEPLCAVSGLSWQ